MVIPPTRIEPETLRELVEQMREPRQREADLRAQLAAGRAGAERVEALIERFGLDTYRDALKETLDYAEARTRARIAKIETVCARRATCWRRGTATSTCR